jgi:hypothetical protein
MGTDRAAFAGVKPMMGHVFGRFRRLVKLALFFDN